MRLTLDMVGKDRLAARPGRDDRFLSQGFEETRKKKTWVGASSPRTRRAMHRSVGMLTEGWDWQHGQRHRRFAASFRFAIVV